MESLDSEQGKIMPSVPPIPPRPTFKPQPSNAESRNQPQKATSSGYQFTFVKHLFA